MLYLERLIERLKEQQKSLQRQIEMMESGQLTTHSNSADTTEESLELARNSLAIIEEVLTRIAESRE